MNHEKKRELLKVTDSYWDILPEEIQIYIHKFKVRQEYLDEQRAKQHKRLCVEIEQYGQLKNKWGLKGIKIELMPCYMCCKTKGYKVWGGYITDCWKLRYMYLGDTLEEALGRCNHVKSFV